MLLYKMVITLNTALSIIKKIKKKYKNFTVVGSVKRKEPVIHDIDLLIRRKYIEEFINKTYDIVYIIKRSSNIINASFENISIDIFLCDDDNYFFAKFMYESPKNYNIRIRRLAKLKGYKLTQYGLYKIVNGKLVSIRINNKKELTKILGITDRTIYDRY